MIKWLSFIQSASTPLVRTGSSDSQTQVNFLFFYSVFVFPVSLKSLGYFPSTRGGNVTFNNM